MPPVGLRNEMLAGLVRVVDDQGGAVAALARGATNGLAVECCLMVRHVRQHVSVGLDPKTERVAAMRDRPGPDLRGADCEVLVAGVGEPDLTPEVRHVDREERRLDGTGQRVLETA